ncbi:ANX [Musa troglodytarum]|uniref:Annexin n=1 Tax=Musa troglodytarum TaxID=320322 RepID=A0A9E7GYZ3_9LILI|nr:ANX [Musa troglodytarum]
MATIKVPATVPSPAEDCDQLRKAFQGWGTNERLIISILAHRTAAQRRAIRATYAEAYGEELLKSLEDEISGDFERAVLLWTLDPADRDAQLANEALRGWDRSNRVLIEIACTRHSSELFDAKRAYHLRYKRSLEEDVAKYTTGDFRKDLKNDRKNEFVAALRAIVRCTCYPQKYLEKIIRLAIKGQTTDANSLTRVVTTRAEVDLKVIEATYYKKNNVPLEQAIKGETSGDHKKMLIALLGYDDA